MRQSILWIGIYFAFFSTMSFGQGFGTIFRAGLNVSSISGPTEMTADGRNLENFSYNTGFHIGAGGRYKFDYNGNYGISAEVLYSLKGGVVSYEGDSYFVFRNSQGAIIRTTGQRRSDLDVSNSYLEFPINLFAKFGKLEIHAGGYAAIRMRSEGTGDYRYSTTVPNTASFEANLIQNYRRDRLSDYSEPFIGNVANLTVGAEVFQIPLTQGAYFEHEEFNGPKYRGYDLGLLGGISYYMTQGLYLGVRFQYGLTDITRDDMHISLYRLGQDNRPRPREEVHRNIAYQVSVGFAF
jgi:hypothetical protein